MDYKFSIHFCLPGYYIAQTFVDLTDDLKVIRAMYWFGLPSLRILKYCMSWWQAAVKVKRSWQVIVAGTDRIQIVWLRSAAQRISVSSLLNGKINQKWII